MVVARAQLRRKATEEGGGKREERVALVGSCLYAEQRVTTAEVAPANLILTDDKEACSAVAAGVIRLSAEVRDLEAKFGC